MKHDSEFYLGCCCGSISGMFFSIGYSIEQFFYNITCCGNDFYRGYYDGFKEVVD